MNAGSAPIEALDAAPMGIVARTIIGALVKAYPRGISAGDMLSIIYSGSREPEFARSALQVQITRLRDKLPAYGWTIPRGRPGRGNTSTYRLERIA